MTKYKFSVRMILRTFLSRVRYLGSLESTEEARVARGVARGVASSNCYVSFVLS